MGCGGVQAKVEERRKTIDLMVQKACQGQGRSGEPITHVDLTHQAVA